MRLPTRPESGRAAGAALVSLLAASVLAAGCGSSDNGKVKANITTGPSGGVSVSSGVTGTPTVSTSGFAVGQNMTVEGTVTKVISSRLFLMSAPQSTTVIPVVSTTESKVKEGDEVTVNGTVAKLDVAALIAQLGAAAAGASDLKQTAMLIQATTVTQGHSGGGSSGSMSPSGTSSP